MGNDLFRATVNKYIDNKMVATATGSFLEIIEKLNITEIKNTYFKLARYDNVTYDYIEDIHFGCHCKKRGGLKITEGIYCNAYLNYLFKTYLQGNNYMNTFSGLVSRYFTFQEAIQNTNKKEDFEKWTQQFFEIPLWKKVTKLNDFNETSGLYALILDEYIKCYIGQAENIKRRILQHWSVDKFFTHGIDLFRAKDTTRIYVIPLSAKELNKNEYCCVCMIPREYRMNLLQGGDMSFHESNNTSPFFEDDKDDKDDRLEHFILQMKMVKKSAAIFVK